jgi:hypothetical protein
MMLQKLLLTFGLLSLAVASAETYRVTLFQPSVVKGTEIKAGDYRLSVTDQKVVLQSGKQSIELTATVENQPAKFESTSVRYRTEAGVSSIAEIRLGGTRMKLVFNP